MRCGVVWGCGLWWLGVVARCGVAWGCGVWCCMGLWVMVVVGVKGSI